jgi:hypothetical protein
MGTVLMSPAVTCLSNMSDTTNAPLFVSAPHEVEEQATVGVKNAASSLHSIRAQTIGIAAVELLKESKSKQRCPDGTAAIGEQMDRLVVSCSHSKTHHLGRRHAPWLSTALLCCSLAAPAQKMTSPGDTSAPFNIPATHLLGFANASNNSTGTLSVQDDSLQFQQNGKPAAKVKIALLRDVFLGAESKQVGGLPMTLGKTAAPFGGGRVVSLFAHKKYDTLTLEYVDADEGIHGAIFQLTKGQGELVKNELIALGVTLSSRQDQSTKESATEAGHENK